jgi:monoamine oxidase
VGLSAAIREKHRDELEAAIIEQLVRCFGSSASKFNNLKIEDWATNPFICSNKDLETPQAHPEIVNGLVREAHCNDRIFFACAETAEQSPGLIEGALDAGSRVAKQILALNRQTYQILGKRVPMSLSFLNHLILALVKELAAF